MQLHKIAARLTAGLLIAGTLSTPALAVQGFVNTEGSRLNMRLEPSVNSGLLLNLDHGTEVDVQAVLCDGAWFEISYHGIVGYASAEYITVNGELPVSEAALAPAAELPNEAPAAPAYARVTTSSLNVRSGPGTDYDKVGQFREGRVVKVLGQQDGWYETEKGFISAEYTSPATEEEFAAVPLTQEIVDYALSFVGYPYVYGGSSPKGFDCSGFTKYVYGHFGYTLNRSAASQLDNGTPVSMDALEPGDLVLFRKGNSHKRATHAGLYIGNGQFVHASTARVGVIVSSLDEAYYTSGFVGGRRIV